MSKIAFKDFLGQFPNCLNPASLPIIGTDADFSHITDATNEFVPPDLLPSDELFSTSQPQVIIISASGAVGKSTIAREIARSKNAPLWDLSLAGPIAQDSLFGKLQRSYGFSNIGRVNSDLQSGKSFLVIDALDEARIKTSDIAFRAFVRDIATLVQPSPSCSILLLGRTQIAETAWLMLDDHKIRTSLYTINPFDDEQARVYIDKRVTIKSGQEQQYQHVRDLIITKLKNSLNAQGIGDDIYFFLGYAPVLAAIATLLSTETNYKSLENSISELSTATHLDVLENVVHHILERERKDKLARNLRPKLQALADTHNWKKWDEIYTAEEQTARLLGIALRDTPTVTTSMPSALTSEYEGGVKTFLHEHPFLRNGHIFVNVVFEAYLFAKALLENSGGLRGKVLSLMNQKDYKPVGLFADFYFQLWKKSGRDYIPPEEIPTLYNACIASESENRYVQMSLDGETYDDIEPKALSDVDCELKIVARTGEESLTPYNFLTSVTAQTNLHFNRSLRNAAITVPCAVTFGTKDDDFEIGPAVQVSCRTININASKLIVGGKTRKRSAWEDSDNSVILESAKCEFMHPPEIACYVPFMVSWADDTSYPWTNFKMTFSTAIISDDAKHEIYRRFRRIALAFRSHSRGTMARLKDKIDNDRIAKGERGKAFLAKLKTDGILKEEGIFYHWIPENADQYVGISWQQLRTGQYSQKLSQYIDSFVRRCNL